VDRIVQIFEAAGAQAKVSSIHVNGWFGAYDKLTMTRRLFRDAFKEDLEAIKARVLFAGDSPNDQPMFAFFPNSVGVANVRSSPDAWTFYRPGSRDRKAGWDSQRSSMGFCPDRQPPACVLSRPPSKQIVVIISLHGLAVFSARPFLFDLRALSSVGFEVITSLFCPPWRGLSAMIF